MTDPKSDKITGREAVTQSSQASASKPVPSASAPQTPSSAQAMPTPEMKAKAQATATYPGGADAVPQVMQPELPERDVLGLLQELNLPEDEAAEPTAVVTHDQLLAVAAELKRRGFMLMDSVGVDYLHYSAPRPKRFCVLHNVYHPHYHRRLFLRIWLDDGETLPSLYPVWKAANYLEREVYDLMGMEFTGHPDLRKVLTPDDLEGHPLRKDFPLGETPTLFNEGRFLDPSAFRAGITGQDSGLTGWRGSLRRGGQRDMVPPVMPEGGPK